MFRRAVIAVALIALSACGQSAPKTSGGPAVLRRLTEDQYRRVIADVFGPDIVVGGRFDPLVRTNGLLEVGAGTTAINASGFESYERLARTIAKQVVDAKHRDWLVPCKPAAADGADEACARAFFKHHGRLLYRRALTDGELNEEVAVAGATAKSLGNFYDGLGAALSAMLMAPEFLFVSDTVESDPDHTGGERLTAYAKASRLSFFLWDAAPDEALLAAAESGDLARPAGLKSQVDRMLASPRLENGVRAFFADMLGMDGFENLQKDSLIYPAFGLATAVDAREQMLRTIADLLLVKGDDYRNLFTTRATFVSGPLGMIYRTPVADPEAWVPYQFPPGDEHVGIQSQAGFVALYSHPGRSSATVRGKAVRELLMCQKVPDPPSNVDFTLVSDISNPAHKTARDRLSAHATQASCSGCHKLVDPIGLSLENFDGAGQWRATENGVPIDSTGEIDGVTYADPAGLGKALHDSPSVVSCLVNRLVTYGTGRAAVPGERPWIDYLGQRFAGDGYRLTALLRRIALDDAFYAVSPATASKPTQSAALNERPSP